MTIKDIKQIQIEDFDYPLPDEKIAKHPLEERDACRLIVAGAEGEIRHRRFSDLPEEVADMPQPPLMICNETRVINARMEFHKETGSRIEIFLLEPAAPSDYVVSFAARESCVWTCMVGNLKKWKGGPLVRRLEIRDADGTVTETELRAELMVDLMESGEAPRGGARPIRFSWSGGVTFASIVEAAGNIPIPPYLKRDSEESDARDYQTVFSRVKGSVAAPTAGLHFTENLLERLEEKGVEIRKVTLHVGAGTFQPVKSDNIGDHPMHTETIDVPLEVIDSIIAALKSGRPIMAVGTTSVRTLESLPYFAESNHVGQWDAYSPEYACADTIGLLERVRDRVKSEGGDSLRGSTAIMIAPGFRWRIVDRMVTNFHQPQSTLLLLVSSFLQPGTPTPRRWREIYDEALAEGYRFLSYGDACLFSRGAAPVELPLSKSIALRADVIRYCLGETPQRDSDIEDVANLERALQALRRGDREVYIGEGGAPLRFFTAVAASTEGSDIIIRGSERLQRRPLAPLIDTLRIAGADIECLETEGFPPIRVRGRRLAPQHLTVDARVSSQFVSALMLSSLLWADGLHLSYEGGAPVSAPYIKMTERMLERAAEQQPLADEADWSAASYIYEAALLRPGHPVKIASLTPPGLSLQGDAACAMIFGAAGVMTRYDDDGGATLYCVPERLQVMAAKEDVLKMNLGNTPDLVPALCVGFALAGIRFDFRGIGHLHHKESDRITALQTEMRKLGYMLESDGDNLAWRGARCEEQAEPVIATYSDHRMAMAFTPARLKYPSLRVEHPEVVAKSFPAYMTEIKKAGVR